MKKKHIHKYTLAGKVMLSTGQMYISGTEVKYMEQEYIALSCSCGKVICKSTLELIGKDKKLKEKRLVK